MCLSTEALVLFLSMISPEIVHPSGSEVRIMATAGAVTWRHQDGVWCLATDEMSPKDAPARTSAGGATG
jgi:hypothetical protein